MNPAHLTIVKAIGIMLYAVFSIIVMVVFVSNDDYI